MSKEFFDAADLSSDLWNDDELKIVGGFTEFTKIQFFLHDDQMWIYCTSQKFPRDAARCVKELTF